MEGRELASLEVASRVEPAASVASAAVTDPTTAARGAQKRAVPSGEFMFDINSEDELWDFIAYVLGGAPDQFPEEDFLPAAEQMNLEKAFALLRKGADLVCGTRPGWADQHAGLVELLDQSLAAYRTGDEDAGASFLNDFEEAAFPGRRT